MKRRLITGLWLAPWLAACGPTQQEADTLAMAEQMSIDGYASGKSADGVPDGLIRCEFEQRSYCIGGDCRKLQPKGAPMYVEIDKQAMAYRRCGPAVGDCDEFKISAFGYAAGYQNAVLADNGVLFKYGPGGHFTDIATQGPQTFVSDGKCVAVDREGR